MKTRKIFALLLSLALIVGLMTPAAFAAPVEDPNLVEIWNVDDLIAFAKESQSGNSFSGKTIKLMADIDFKGDNYLEIDEEGTVVTDYRIPKFSGTFDGNGHTIKNFNFVVKNTGKHSIMMFSQDNMWAYIRDLNIENVTVDVADISGETRITALANRVNAGGMTDAAIKNVHVKNFKIVSDNTTSGDLRIGGLAYFVQGSQLIAKDCSIDGFEVDVNEALLVGGAVAVVKSKCDFENVDVKNAVFNIDKFGSSGIIGGFVAQTQDQGTGTTFTDCDVVEVKMDLGSIGNNVGGFVGSIGSVSQFYDCKVEGSIAVTNSSASIGGFAGDLGWNGMFAPNVQHEFNNCVADVDITADNANVGGFIGDSTVSGYPKRYMPTYFSGCEAKGDVKTTNGAAGGFVGIGDRGVFSDCSASGNVEGNIAGGFWGEVYPKSEAESTGGWSYQDKVVTHTDPESKSIVLEEVVATGTVTGTEYEAGLIGFMKDIYVNTDGSLGYVTPVILSADNNTNDYNRYEYSAGTDTPVTLVVKVGKVGYPTLAQAIEAANAIEGGATVTLLADIELAETLTILAEKTVTLDLNGKTIDGTGNVRIALMSYGDLTVKDSSENETGVIKAGIGTAGNAVNICGGTFTLESGSIYSLNNGILIDEQAATVTIKGGKITAEPTTNNSSAFYISSTSDTVINIEAGEMVGYNGILLWNNTTITMTGGSITGSGTEGVGIQGNGSKDNTAIAISGGSVTGGEVGIYHPQGGTLTISDSATISGGTGIVVKGGTINISGGTISGTGAAAAYEPKNSGFNGTGDALYVEHYDNSTNSENYGTPTVTVTGGTFTSTNAAAVASYANPNNEVDALTGFITGGTFSSDPSAYVVEGKKAAKSGDVYIIIPATSYLVTFDANGGNAVASKYSHELTSLPTPTRTGSYSFSGWYLADGTKVTSVSDIKADATLIAHWNYTGGSSSSSSSSNTTTSTEKNPDGSTTTTTTNKVTGTVTETTKNTDGSSTVVETQKDGTVTTTEKTAEGVTSTVVEDKKGNVTEVSATVPAAAAKEAAENDKPVTLPVEVEAPKDSDDVVEISVNVPSNGATVEIPVEDVTPGTVVVIVNADGTETIVPTTTLTEDGVVVTLDEDATIKVIDNSKDFIDVPDTYTLSDSIDFVAARGLFEGTSEVTYEPHANTTVAQTMTVLARLSGEDFYGPGSTTKGAEWAAENGIADGTENVSAPVTRQQMVVMMWRLAGMPMSDHPLTAPDAHEIDAHALVAMQWAVEMGILKGNLDGTIDPHGIASRAHVAAFTERYVNAIA